MKEHIFGARSIARLEGVHPALILVVSRGLLYSPIDFAITEGLRDIARQRELVAKGASRTMRSRHLRQPSGFAEAVDVVAVGDLDGDGDADAQDRARAWDVGHYRAIAVAMKRAAHEVGVAIGWGGDFKSFFDGPHFQLER